MNLSDLKDKVTLELATQPQRQAKAVAAVDSLSSGLAELAALGYRYAVVEEFGAHSAPSPQEYPKMLYRTGAFPTELTVEDEVEEEKARENGYAGRNDPAPQPAVNSQPKNPSLAPLPEALKPAMTEKEVVESRIAAGSGASKPNAGEAAKT